MHVYNWYHSHFQTFIMYTTQITICMAHSPCFPYFPLLIPLAPLSNPTLLTWNPPSCDRICPPQSQVACKLTPPIPPCPQTLPLQIPGTQFTQRLTKTTSRWIRHLLSGTLLFPDRSYGDIHKYIPEIIFNISSFSGFFERVIFPVYSWVCYIFCSTGIV